MIAKPRVIQEYMKNMDVNYKKSPDYSLAMKASLRRNSLYTIAFIASAMIEWIITYISGSFRLTLKYHSTFSALMKARLKQHISYVICRT
jgi:hypothetical protein